MFTHYPEESKFPWYIHSQSKKLMLLGKNRTLKHIESMGGYELFMALIQQYGGKQNIPGAQIVFSNLFSYLSEEKQYQLIPHLNLDDFINNDQKRLKKMQKILTIKQRKDTLLNHLVGSQNKKIILVAESALLDTEVHEGIWHYIEKHGKAVCGFATSEEEISTLVKGKPVSSCLLVCINHWQQSWTEYSIWTHSLTVEMTGKFIAETLNKIKEIGALRLISCHAGVLEENTLKIPDKVTHQETPRHRTLTFIRDYQQNGEPFATTSLAKSIWEHTEKSEEREFSLMASPAYITFFNQRFVGSEHCHDLEEPSFSANRVDDYAASKTICLTTPHGLKAV